MCVFLLLHESTSKIHYANQQHAEDEEEGEEEDVMYAIKIALHHFIELHLQLIKLLLLCIVSCIVRISILFPKPQREKQKHT